MTAQDDLYQQVFKKHAAVHKALANTKRLEIVHLLRDQSLSVLEMVGMLGLSQSNLSQHLSILRQAGLVKARKEGVSVYYRLSSPKIIAASDMVRTALLSQVEDEKQVAETDLNQVFEVRQDPVCKMHVNAKTAADKAVYQGKTYYFCATGCKKQFLEDPKTYV
jgi:ArsR family transcriptional regulator